MQRHKAERYVLCDVCSGAAANINVYVMFYSSGQNDSAQFVKG